MACFHHVWERERGQEFYWFQGGPRGGKQLVRRSYPLSSFFFFLKSPNPRRRNKGQQGNPRVCHKRGLERITGPTIPAGPHVTDSNSRGTRAGGHKATRAWGLQAVCSLLPPFMKRSCCGVHAAAECGIEVRFLSAVARSPTCPCLGSRSLQGSLPSRWASLTAFPHLGYMESPMLHLCIPCGASCLVPDPSKFFLDSQVKA